MSIKDIVNVQITRETQQVSRQGFGFPMILGINKGMIAVVGTFSSLEEVGESFNSSSREYLAAQAFFVQSPSVTAVKIGRRATSDITTITVATVANLTLYSITLNGEVVNFTSDASATAIEIAAGLVTAINLTAQPVTAAAVGDGTYTLTADVSGAAYTVKTDTKQTTAFTTSTTVDADIDSINTADSTWYAMVTTSRTSADVANMALKIESMQKIFGIGSSDANIVNTTDSADTTTIAAIIKAGAATRSFVIFNSNAATQFPECALLGKVLPLNPGSWTAKFKTLAGITVDVATSTQRTNALAKNCTIYTEVGGANITEDGKVGEGEYLDVIVFVDYLQARITEEVYATLVQQAKVPYTDSGIALIQSKINAVLQDGILLGGLASSPAYTITVPKASSISAVDKGARVLTGVKFSAPLAGAIHAVTINGTVTL